MQTKKKKGKENIKHKKMIKKKIKNRTKEKKEKTQSNEK